MNCPGISIVIPAYNEEKFLAETLESLQRARKAFQRKFGRPTEVIVVNNGSDDGTELVAKGLGAQVVAHSERNIASARNAGIRAAAFDIVVTVDADGLVPAHALVEIWEAMTSGQYVGGGVRVGIQTQIFVVRTLTFVVDRLILYGFGVSVGMFFFWKSAAEHVDGFPENLLVGEDTAFALLLKREARRQDLRFCNLHSVRLITKDRKRISVREGFATLWHVLRQVLGREVTREQLAYWYHPTR
jgi:glycosyltransferase involved in cell wall biosynthesis